MSQPMPTPESGVVIRMYRANLGDCFLLRFAPPAKDAAPFHLLIDCGIHHLVPGHPKMLAVIAEDIAEQCGRHLDAVVATHPHYDHTSGFKCAQPVFDRITIGELWLAWTENPSDRAAAPLRAFRLAMEHDLRALCDREEGRRSPLAAAGHLEGVRHLLGFCEGADEAPGTQAADSAKDASVTLAPGPLAAAKEKHAPPKPHVDYLKREKDPRYLKPGDGVDLPGQVKVRVLGPPTQEKWLKQMNPDAPGQIYAQGLPLGPEVAFAAAALGDTSHLAEGVDDAAERSQPFAASYRVPQEHAAAKTLYDRYFDADEEWARIDDEWLSAAEDLALSLDRVVNNTSLVLAIELPKGRVLLFPGDAQVGNWRSWCEDSPEAEELLGRVVLYKVGHHGSENATLKKHGLEAMRHPALQALIPVDQEQASRMAPDGWDMPHGHLLDALRQATNEHIYRSDKMDGLFVDITVEDLPVR